MKSPQPIEVDAEELSYLKERLVIYYFSEKDRDILQKELERRAAQSDLIHNDDTTNKNPDLIKENRTETNKERTVIFTIG